MNSRKKKLIEIMGEGNVYDDPKTLKRYSRDESFSLPMSPSFVVKAADAERVEAIVHWANRTRTPLIPVSSGPPRFRGDTVPGSPESVVVDLSGMKKIIRIDRRNRMALIEPGVTFAQIQPALAKEGLRLSTPLLPRANKSVVASLLEREPSIIPKHQWAFLDPLRCLEVVWGDGNRFMTGEAGLAGTLADEWKMGHAQVAAAGPAQANFYKFLSAAQGTMGIATWASVKCQVLPSVHRLFFVPSEGIDRLIDFAYRLLRIRFGDELLFLNGLNTASILGNGSLKIQSLSEKLPPWILMVGIAGRDILPKERVEFQEKDIGEMARQAGLELLSEFPGADAGEMLDGLLNPSREPYWKLTYKGGCQDIFFLATLDRVPVFMKTMVSVADACGYPSSDIGVYIQPVHQGVCCHCEFNLPFDPDNRQEATRIRELFLKASEELLKQGAFFSRPYGMWADMAFNRDGRTTSVLKKVKGIFDPRGVMNPGKLCF